jgi:glycerol-3-phosphate acyltransferase PlsY
MQVLNVIGALLGSYIIGSIPFGLIIVWLVKKKDIRTEHSGRTGGTNVMRSAGFLAGLITGIADFSKAFLAVILARMLTGGNPWVEAFAGLLAVVGHNYSLFLIERVGDKFKFRGGAGGGSSVGAATAMWPPTALIVIPLGLLILFGLGYASVSTISVGLIFTGLFIYRAAQGIGPWAYVVFGILVDLLLLWGLKSNIQRLKEGKERLIGWRAKQQERLRKKRDIDTHNLTSMH